MNGNGPATATRGAVDSAVERAADDGIGRAARENYTRPDNPIPLSTCDSTRIPTTDAEENATPESGSSNATVVRCNSECHIVFNVMPDRTVKEELRIREFRIGRSWIEAEFDRAYYSSMLNSPSHLTFVSALIQMQKVTYVYSCHRFGFDPDVQQPEVLKIWPTNASITMRDMVTDEKCLVHRMDFTGYRKIEDRKYLATATSRIGALQIDASAVIILLRPPCWQD